MGFVVDGVVRVQMSPDGEEGEGDKEKPDQRGWLVKILEKSLKKFAIFNMSFAYYVSTENFL